MLTDEIMDQIETNTGVSEEAAARYTSTQTAYDNEKTLNQHNIQENDTMDLSSELKGGTGTTTTDPTEQTAMDTEEGEERQPTKRRASEAGVDIPESAVDSTVEQLKHDVEKLARQNHESIAAILRGDARFTKAGTKIEGNTNILEAMQTRIDVLENNNSSSSSGSHKRNDQN